MRFEIMLQFFIFFFRLVSSTKSRRAKNKEMHFNLIQQTDQNLDFFLKTYIKTWVVNRVIVFKIFLIKF